MTDEQLFDRVAQIFELIPGQGARTVNTAIVQDSRHIGREIVVVEQVGEQHAGMRRQSACSSSAVPDTGGEP